MAKMIGKKAFYNICVCRDCGGIDIAKRKRTQKRKEDAEWRRDVW